MKRYIVALIVGVTVLFGTIDYALASCPSIPNCASGVCYPDTALTPNPIYITGSASGDYLIQNIQVAGYTPINGYYCQYYLGTSSFSPVQPGPALVQAYPGLLWNHGYKSNSCDSCFVNSFVYIPAIKQLYNSYGTLCGYTTGGQSGITWWDTGNPACYTTSPP